MHNSERMKYMAANDSADNFWKVSTLVVSEGSELFRKLVNGYAGQGESERMNKMVKKFRTTLRNRQTHAVTSSYMELDMIYKMIRKSTQVKKKFHTLTRYEMLSKSWRQNIMMKWKK